jgi:dihydroneopterin aldolase
MLDHIIRDTETGQIKLTSPFLGEMFLRFGTTGSTITSRESSFPFYGNGKSFIDSEIRKIKEARQKIDIHLAYDNTVTINSVDYEGISFEVQMFHDKSQLSVNTRAKRKDCWNYGITDAARNKLRKEIESTLFDLFEELAEELRELEIERFKHTTFVSLTSARDNLKAAFEHLGSL